MGFIETEERRRLEIEEFKRLLLSTSTSLISGHGAKIEDEEFKNWRFPWSSRDDTEVDDDDINEKVVCVTSGVSFLGLAIVNRLLLRGYFVRIIVDNEDDVEKLRELEESAGERNSNRVKTVMAKLTGVESLSDAFEGCCGVFHTSAFTDPAGLSGYTKSMAEIEARACENVIEACSRTPSVRYCLFTSSLLACIWGDVPSHRDHPTATPILINHDSWSDDLVCCQKKLWYALGKLKAERTAWRMAKEKGLKLATICPGLITGPDFFQRNPTASVAYLKGAQEMFEERLLATVDVMKVAEAHACVFEAMKKTAFGRYICYDRIIDREEEAERLAMAMEVPPDKIHGNNTRGLSTRFQLSNNKLFTLMATRTFRTCYNHD